MRASFLNKVILIILLSSSLRLMVSRVLTYFVVLLFLLQASNISVSELKDDDQMSGSNFKGQNMFFLFLPIHSCRMQDFSI